VLAAIALPSWAAADESSLCLEGSNAPEQTVDHCTSAMAGPQLSESERSALLTRRGLARFAQRKTELAAADFDAAIRSNANSHWAYNSRAVLWMQRGNVDLALADYDTAIRLKPDYAFALANRGNAWLIKGMPDRALEDLDRAAALAPSRLELVLTGKGKARLAQGDYTKAAEQFAAALQVNPQYANAVSGRAYAQFCQGDFDAAAEGFAKEHRLRPDPESAIAWVVARRRGGHDARDVLAEVTRNFPGDQGLPAGLALFSGTLTPQQAVQAGADPDPQIRRARLCAANFQAGQWYLVQKDAALARRHLQTARETCDMSQPEFAAAAADLVRLGAK
jgi:tetratricopeptide (TPR) repeat protein